MSSLSPSSLVSAWVAAFNRQDVDALAGMYAEDAVNHQVAEAPVVVGRRSGPCSPQLRRAEMVCIVENLFEDGEWAILEWRDPLGLRGWGSSTWWRRIVFQRGYWDKLTSSAAWTAHPAGLGLPT